MTEPITASKTAHSSDYSQQFLDCEKTADLPTAECLLQRREQLERFLSRRSEKFSPWVIERAIDNVFRAALPYLSDQKACKLANAKDRERWLFGAALKAARQVASRELPCDLIDPGVLVSRLPGLTVVGTNLSARDQMLHDALDLLTPRQREALDLCIVYGLTREEAALRMNCCPNNVNSHLIAAVKRLTALLEKRLYTGDDALLEG